MKPYGGHSEMPSHSACEREDQVVDLVIADLSQSGRLARVVDRPDRGQSRRADGLTVDVELEVDGERWAMDVTTLRWHSGLEGAVQKLEDRLTKEFGPQLEAVGRTLIVTCRVSKNEKSIHSIIELARQAVVSGQNQRRGDEAAALYPWSPELGAVEVQPWLGQLTNLTEEIVLAFGNSLEEKLKGQLVKARALGYRTCLAIDQRGSPDLKYGANFLPLPETILIGVHKVETKVGTSCDYLAIIRENDAVHWIRS